MKYKEQLLQREWKKKREEILFRDRYRCQVCLGETRLEVHHRNYHNYRYAWECSSYDLITLCHNCHDLFEYNKRKSGYCNYEIDIPDRVNHKNTKDFKYFNSFDFNELENKIIDYINRNNINYYKVYLDSNIFFMKQTKGYKDAIENLIKAKLIKPTKRENIYEYNTIYFGCNL